MAVAGVPLPVEDHANRAVNFGLGIHRVTDELAAELQMPLELRVGIHSGPLVAGVIGRDKLAYDLWGDTVNVASRMESQGMPGRIQVSEVTAQRLTAGVSLEPRGTIEVRGRGPMRVLLVSLPEDEAAELPVPESAAESAAEPAESADLAGSAETAEVHG
jgi:class 3 adenylate cyclase